MVVLSGMCVSRLDAHIPRQRQSPSPKPFPTGLCVCVVCLFVPAGKKTQQTQVCLCRLCFVFVCVIVSIWERGARDTRLSLEPKPNLVATHYHHHHHHHHHLFLFWCVVLVCLFVCLFVCVTDSFLCLFVCWLVTTIFGVWEWGLGLWLGITHDTQRDIRAEGGGTICLNQPHHIQSTQKQSFCEP